MKKLEAFTIALTYVRNSKGQRTDPCATPHAIGKKKDLISVILAH